MSWPGKARPSRPDAGSVTMTFTRYDQGGAIHRRRKPRHRYGPSIANEISVLADRYRREGWNRPSRAGRGFRSVAGLGEPHLRIARQHPGVA